jgi:hypothetical protein
LGIFSLTGRSISAPQSSARPGTPTKHASHGTWSRPYNPFPHVKQIGPNGDSAAFDRVGKDTFVKSFDCTAPLGMVVNYGNDSGHAPPIDILKLLYKRSLSVCRVGVSQFLAIQNTSGSSRVIV